MFCIFLHFFYSAQVRGSANSNSRERHFLSSLLPKQLRFQSNIPPNRWSIAHIFRGIGANQEKLRNGKTFLMDNNKICWTRYRIEKCITTWYISSDWLRGWQRMQQLANQNRQRQSNHPIKTQSRDTQQPRSAGKRVGKSSNWFSRTRGTRTLSQSQNGAIHFFCTNFGNSAALP